MESKLNDIKMEEEYQSSMVGVEAVCIVQQWSQPETKAVPP